MQKRYDGSSASMQRPSLGGRWESTGERIHAWLLPIHGLDGFHDVSCQIFDSFFGRARSTRQAAGQTPFGNGNASCGRSVCSRKGLGDCAQWRAAKGKLAAQRDCGEVEEFPGWGLKTSPRHGAC